MRWGIAITFLAAACATSGEQGPHLTSPEKHGGLTNDLARFAVMSSDGRLTFSSEHPETLEITRRGQLTLVNQTAPFAVVGRNSERTNSHNAISFYRLPADRIIAHNAGNSSPQWAHSNSCPALHDVAKALDAAKIPPPEPTGQDRVICTADCTTYALTINGSSGADFSVGERVDNDNVWRIFRQANDLPHCWRAELQE